MLHLMEEKPQGAKKKIRVRKSSTPNSGKSSLNYEDDYYIPLAANDSQWNGIEFRVPRNENTEHINSITDHETELKVIELDADERPPLLLLFPELKQEELNLQNIINDQMSTTDVTKILVGKKPNLALLKPCSKLNSIKELPSLNECSESDDSLENKNARQGRQNYDEKSHRKDSRDADDSDNCD